MQSEPDARTQLDIREPQDEDERNLLGKTSDFTVQGGPTVPLVAHRLSTRANLLIPVCYMFHSTSNNRNVGLGLPITLESSPKKTYSHFYFFAIFKTSLKS